MLLYIVQGKLEDYTKFVLHKSVSEKTDKVMDGFSHRFDQSVDLFASNNFSLVKQQLDKDKNDEKTQKDDYKNLEDSDNDQSQFVSKYIVNGNKNEFLIFTIFFFF